MIEFNDILRDWAETCIKDVPIDAHVDIADKGDGVTVKWIDDGKWREQQVRVSMFMFTRTLTAMAIGRIASELLAELERLLGEIPYEDNDFRKAYAQGVRDSVKVFKRLLEGSME